MTSLLRDRRRSRGHLGAHYPELPRPMAKCCLRLRDGSHSAPHPFARPRRAQACAAAVAGLISATSSKRDRKAIMIKLKGIGHVNLRVADQEVSKHFYPDVLGFLIAEEDP